MANEDISRQKLVDEDPQVRISTFEHFEATIRMLNESMGMCLPTSALAARQDGMPEDGLSG